MWMALVLRGAAQLLSTLPAVQKVSFQPDAAVTRTLHTVTMGKNGIDPDAWRMLEATLTALKTVKCVEFVFSDILERTRLCELVKTGLPTLCSDGRLEVRFRPGDQETTNHY